MRPAAMRPGWRRAVRTRLGWMYAGAMQLSRARVRAGAGLVVRETFATGLGLLAADRGGLVGKQPLVVLAPHPDDETLGCGATIARAAALGAPVVVVVATAGEAWQPGSGQDRKALAATREEELARACARLGVRGEDIVQLGLPDGSLATCEEELERGVRDVVWRLGAERPPLVLTTAESDPHPDHAALGRVARRLAAELGLVRYEYPIWQWKRPGGCWTLLAWGDGGRPVKVSTRGFLASKEAALAAHRSQLLPELGGDGPSVLGRRFAQAFLRANELFVEHSAPR